MSPAALYRNFGSILTGGLVHNAFDVAIGAADPYTAWSSRSLSFHGEDYPPEADEFVRWAIRRITSLGWRVTDVEEHGDNYFKTLRRAFVSGLVKEKRDRLKSMEARGAPIEEQRPVEDEIGRLEGIVDNEMDNVEAYYRTAIEKVRRKPAGER